MKLLIRTDSSPQIGTGHLMRCLALAQAYWSEVVFALSQPTPLQQRLESEGMGIVLVDADNDAIETVKIARRCNCEWVVVDGYQFDQVYLQQLQQSGLRVLLLDDYAHAQFYGADIVLNQNISASESLYQGKISPATKLLLGTKYTLLRHEFQSWQGWQPTISPVAQKILVTLGGSDPPNFTFKVIQALQQIENITVKVIVGGSNPHLPQLQTAVKNSPIQLQQNVTDMPELMAWADLAIAAGGSTNWELAFMGLPSIIIILADNQKAIAQKLADAGVVVNLGWHKEIEQDSMIQTIDELVKDKNRRLTMSQQGKKLVDGKGSRRVLDHLSTTINLIPSNADKIIDTNSVNDKC